MRQLHHSELDGCLPCLPGKAKPRVDFLLCFFCECFRYGLYASLSREVKRAEAQAGVENYTRQARLHTHDNDVIIWTRRSPVFIDMIGFRSFWGLLWIFWEDRDVHDSDRVPMNCCCPLDCFFSALSFL